VWIGDTNSLPCTVVENACRPKGTTFDTYNHVTLVSTQPLKRNSEELFVNEKSISAEGYHTS